MKNIHVLPTDKPSRLYSYYGMLENLSYGKTFTIVNEDIAKLNLHKDLKDYQEKLIKAGWKAENIYITSSEEIKEGDWKLFGKNNELSKATYGLDEIDLKFNKKIILTTDPDLIKDGVQAIEDEFLEWFVKNPSCEEVEIGEGVRYEDEWIDNEDGGEIFQHQYCSYKIIIPKEEPKPVWKQIIETCGGEEEFIKATGLLPKQETLEEIDWKLVYEDSLSMQKCSNAGYESKIRELQSKIEKMYSEADKIMKFLDTEVELKLSDVKTIERIKWYFETYFEQFKKKQQ